MTRQQQISDLIKLGSRGFLHAAKPVLVIIVAAFIILGAITGRPVFYAVALIAGLLTFAVWQTTPHMLNAAMGLRKGICQSGRVEILLHRWKAAESEHESYRGIISQDGQPLWQMDFVQPRGWIPAIGPHPAELYFIQGVEWPVVLVLQDGILYPGSKPRRPGEFQKFKS